MVKLRVILCLVVILAWSSQAHSFQFVPLSFEKVTQGANRIFLGTVLSVEPERGSKNKAAAIVGEGKGRRSL